MFDRLVPLLILFATLLFAVQERVQRMLNVTPEHHGSVWFTAAMIFQFFVSVYGGYFGAGMGILMLAALAVLGHDDIHQMNGIKNLLAVFINAVAAGVLHPCRHGARARRRGDGDRRHDRRRRGGRRGTAHGTEGGQAGRDCDRLRHDARVVLAAVAVSLRSALRLSADRFRFFVRWPLPTARFRLQLPPVATHPRDKVEISRYVDLTRAEWARLRASTPLPLSEAQLRPLGGVTERVSLDEVSDVYLPLSRLLNLYVGATQKLHAATSTFLGGSPDLRIPYIIGIAGSVAVGKSTTSRVLKALLSHWPSHPRVDLVTTDGFLHAAARARSARVSRSGRAFPESYDVRRLLRFLADVKSGLAGGDGARSTRTSAYDIVPGRVSDRPPARHSDRRRAQRAADRIAAEEVAERCSSRTSSTSRSTSTRTSRDIEQWYIERFLKLRATVFQDPSSYFHRYASLTGAEAEATARRIWQTINLVNLRENVLPTRERAHLVLEKGRDHAVRRVRLTDGVIADWFV